MSLDYVIHALPYHHQSAGIRALYELGKQLDQRGATVATWNHSSRFLHEMQELPPTELLSSNQFTVAEVKDAIHIVPEFFTEPPAERSVRWLLSSSYQEVEGFLQFEWFGLEYPRLCLDLIEKEFFYPKTEPGDGLLIWGGKYPLAPSDEELGLWPKQITHQWPATRKELGDVLRGAEGLISYDPISMMNLEATICGTPVLMARGEMPPQTLFGLFGVITDANDFFEGNEQAKLAADNYDEVRDEIRNDVDEFELTCRLKWS